MTFLFDTTVLVDVARHNELAVRLLSQTPNITISAVSAWELIQGARDKQELREIETFLSSVNVIEVDEHISRKSRGLLTSYVLSHGLHILDAMIAATALVRRCTLVTDNVRDFSFISGLAVVKPMNALGEKRELS